MRLAGTLSAYVLREVLLYSSLGLVLIGALLVSRNALRHLEGLAGAGPSYGDVLLVLASLAISLAVYVVPIAFLFGVLVAVARLSSDGEVAALHTCGVGLRALLQPVTALAIVIAFVTAYLVLDVEHRAKRRLRLAVQTLATEGRLVQPGGFRRVGERTIHARHRGEDGRLEEVLIEDRSDSRRPFQVFAESGEVDWIPGADTLRLRLREGGIHFERPEPPTADRAPHRPGRVSFRSFDYSLAAKDVLGVSLSALRPREMSIQQLRSVIARADAGESLTGMRREDPVHYRLQLHRRFALPVAPVLFALIGVPLAVRRVRATRSGSVLACALVVFAYYALLALGQSLAVEAWIPAFGGVWLPNAVFAGTSVFLLRDALRAPG